MKLQKKNERMILCPLKMRANMRKETVKYHCDSCGDNKYLMWKHGSDAASAIDKEFAYVPCSCGSHAKFVCVVEPAVPILVGLSDEEDC
jgi:hypothetical protein